jgi:hypothetical protein
VDDRLLERDKVSPPTAEPGFQVDLHHCSNGAPPSILSPISEGNVMDDHSPALEHLRTRFYRQLFALGAVVVFILYTVSDTLVFSGCRIPLSP